MKIAYLIQYFGPPDNSFASARSYDFVKKWAEEGHQIWVICSDSYLIDKKKEITIDGLPVKVTVISQAYRNHFSLLNRIYAFFFFSLKALLLLLRNRKDYDILYASSTPLTIGGVGVMQKILLRKPWIFEIRDLWPEFPVEVLKWQGTLKAKLLFMFEKWCYRSAKHIICLSPLVKEHLVNEKKIPDEKLSTIPNGYSFVPEGQKHIFTQEFQTGIYEGALGKANGIEWLMEFVNVFLAKQKNGRFIIAGFGKKEDEILNWIESHPHKNRIDFKGTLSRNQILKELAKVDFALAPFSDYATLLMNSPNKIFDGFPNRIPVITNTGKWIGELAEMTGGFFEKDASKAARRLLNGEITIKQSLPEQFFREKLAKEVLTIIQKCG